MTVNFQPDICLPKDPEGFGRWLDGHAFEHNVIQQKLLALNFTVPQYNLLFWDDKPSVVQSWLQSHGNVHQQIDQVLNITSIDFSQVDLSKEDEWFSWMDDHASEHQNIRDILGMT